MNASEKEIDRSEWGPGPWDGEPDRVEGEHCGLPTLARRGPMGTWCGYVAVPPGHPKYRVPYNAYDEGDETVDVSVHGGLTYSDACQGEICHVPKPGEPDDVWWFGFDCGHAGDITPEMLKYRFGSYHGQTYKDLAYVQAEIKHLAEQLAAMK